jgi:hypothetical protein
MVTVEIWSASVRAARQGEQMVERGGLIRRVDDEPHSVSTSRTGARRLLARRGLSSPVCERDAALAGVVTVFEEERWPTAVPTTR